MSTYFSSCLLCGSPALLPMARYASASLVRCAKCNFVFSSRKPSAGELKDHYATYPPEINISSITVKRYNELLDGFEKFRKTNNLLDVGCGNGYFLTEAKKRKWNVYGTEYRENMVQACSAKGISMKHGPLVELNYEPDFFDVVTSFEVIEHINNPAGEMSAFKKVVRKGGALYITTPNFDSMSRLILKNKWKVVEYPEHLCYYTKGSLQNALKQYGFSMLDYKTTGISLSSFAQPSPGSGTGEELIRERIEDNRVLSLIKGLINALLTITRKGDALKMLFIKSG